jgi:tetratricopeptide (TPR) repeat protein
MPFRHLMRVALLTAAIMVSACDNAEERAERHFQSGMEYLESGDIERALVEFRNVFKLNGTHREARLVYARVERDRGRPREAYSQYLRLVEQYPDDLEGLTALSELAADAGEWAEVDRYLTVALAQAPQDPHLLAIKLFREYGAAIEANDTAAIVATVQSAETQRAANPGELLLHKIVVDDLIRGQKFDAALAELNAAIAAFPEERLLFAQRLSVNAALGDDAAVEAGLIEMVGKFPDSPEMREALLRWYLSRKEYDKAEAHLRAQVDPTSDGPQPIVALVRFLGEFRGGDAAIAELDKAIAAGKSVPVFRSARAGFLFDKGDRDGAIAEMEAILEGAEDSDETRAIKVGLARMQLSTGNPVAARALVEEVLAQDSGHVEATKLKAAWLILDDKVGDAVTLLRDAIDQNPRDPALMTLMAQAYERDGNRDLMRDMLAQAVEASGRAPEETLRYAQLLAAEDKLLQAETVLIDALRIAPGNIDLLIPLGQIYVALKDWPRAETVADELERLNEPGAKDAIVQLRAASLEGQQKAGDALSYLQGLVAADEGGLAARVAVLRNHLANGRTAEAVSYAEKLRADEPENPDVLYVYASVQAIAGRAAEAESGFRALVERDPSRTIAWLALFKTVHDDPARKAEAAKILDEALAAVPESGELRWARAGMLEMAGDIEGAITIYEQLYKENSANPIVANNLASLLSGHRKDPESLARAEVIARRLRGSNVAPYQDTYGWIAYLTGNHAEAVVELERAATGLPKDPTVQYHLGMAYLATGRKPEAAAQFRRVADMTSPDDGREFAAKSREELAKLETEGVGE